LAACNDEDDFGTPAPKRPVMENSEVTFIAGQDPAVGVVKFHWISEQSAAAYAVALSVAKAAPEGRQAGSEETVTIRIPDTSTEVGNGVRELIVEQKFLTDLAAEAGYTYPEAGTTSTIEMALTVEALQSDGTPFPSYGTFETDTYRSKVTFRVVLGDILTLAGEGAGYKACASAAYRIAADALKGLSDHGLCWNTSGDPTLADSFAPGPEPLVPDGVIRQFVSNADLAHGTTYYVRAYATTEQGHTFYTEEQTTVRLSVAEIEPIALEWTRHRAEGLPDGIEVYKTTSKLNGRDFSAWYAVADCTGEIELRVQMPEGVKRLAEQCGDDCYVLVNGGYFDMSAGTHDGVYVVGGKAAGCIYSQCGDWGGGPAKDMWFPVTRSLFGVDASGHPLCCWAGSTGDAEPYEQHYYDRPLTSIRYDCNSATPMARYAGISATCPAPQLDWKPEYAVSAGPMLLKHGRCMVGNDVDANWYPITDWEMWDYYLSVSDYIRAQTAIGCTADGRVVLFSCGLTGGSGAACGGASLGETAAIMKAVGCVEALKLDGGGSAGLAVCDGTDSSVTERAVLTTVGFFRR